MSERWWCTNCLAVRELNIHGRCANCDSDAVDLAWRGTPFQSKATDEVAQLEALLRRS